MGRHRVYHLRRWPLERTSLTEQFNSGMFDYTRMCPCKRRPLWAQTVTDVIVYELLILLFHIGNFCFHFLNSCCSETAVDFIEICNVCARKAIIKAAERVFNSDKICHSYCGFHFGVTFFGTQCYKWFLLPFNGAMPWYPEEVRIWTAPFWQYNW